MNIWASVSVYGTSTNLSSMAMPAARVELSFMRCYIGSARRALLELCRGEALVILRNVPGRREAPNNPTAITLVGRSTVICLFVRPASVRARFDRPFMDKRRNLWHCLDCSLFFSAILAAALAEAWNVSDANTHPRMSKNSAPCCVLRK